MGTEKDQVTERPQSLDEMFEKGWQNLEAETSVQDKAVEAKAKEETAEKKEPPCDAPPCKEARAKAEADAAAAVTKGGYPKTLKVAGKDVVVNSKRELAEKIAEFYEDDKMVNLGQMSADYTRKRQADAEAERLLQEKHDNLERIAERLDRHFENLGLPEKPGNQPEPKRLTAEEEKAKIYARYSIDPEYADEGQIQLVNDVYEMQKKMDKIDAMTSAMEVKEKMGELAVVLKAAREQYPIDEIMSEDGKDNLTAIQFVSRLKAKDQEARGRGVKEPNLMKLGEEVIKEIHFMQQQSKPRTAETVTDEMNPDKFAEKFPKLAAAYSESAKAKARAEYDAEIAALPPSLRARRAEVSLPKAMGADGKTPQTFEEFLEKGLDDPEVAKAFRGE